MFSRNEHTTLKAEQRDDLAFALVELGFACGGVGGCRL